MAKKYKKGDPAPDPKSYPNNSKGKAAYQADYKAWQNAQTPKPQELDVPPILLPGVKAGEQLSVDQQQAKDWFKFTAPKAAKGTPARIYYDSFVSMLAKAGIPKSKYNSVWADAVSWVQAPGSGSKGDPKLYLSSGFSAADYASTAKKAPATTKSKTTTTTQYSPSSAGSTINSTIENELGRTTTSDEVAAYLKGVNEKAKLEPSVYENTSTTKVTGSGANAVSSTVTNATQSTGFDPAIFAQNFARSLPDYAESFAAKNFLRIVDSLIGPDRTAIGKVVEQ
jgi:hypothetical protein